MTVKSNWSPKKNQALGMGKFFARACEPQPEIKFEDWKQELCLVHVSDEDIKNVVIVGWLVRQGFAVHWAFDGPHRYVTCDIVV